MTDWSGNYVQSEEAAIASGMLLSGGLKWNALTGAAIVPAGLDPGIQIAVEVLMDAGIETFESCQGGEGHSYPEPTVRFHGERPEGFKALSAVMYDGRLKVSELRRTWPIQDGEPVGPHWELVFVPNVEK